MVFVKRQQALSRRPLDRGAAASRCEVIVTSFRHSHEFDLFSLGSEFDEREEDGSSIWSCHWYFAFCLSHFLLPFRVPRFAFR